MALKSQTENLINEVICFDIFFIDSIENGRRDRNSLHRRF